MIYIDASTTEVSVYNPHKKQEKPKEKNRGPEINQIAIINN